MPKEGSVSKLVDSKVGANVEDNIAIVVAVVSIGFVDALEKKNIIFNYSLINLQNLFLPIVSSVVLGWRVVISESVVDWCVGTYVGNIVIVSFFKI